MTTINPYFTFNGNCEEVMNFYKSVFGGEFRDFSRFRDMPQDEANPIPEAYLDKLMHVALPISNETILMASDSHPLYPPITIGQHISMSVNVESKADADRIFNGLSAGGKITMPMDTTFWNAYFGMLEDKFGIAWMINCDLK